MTQYSKLSKSELEELLNSLKKEYEDIKSLNLSLDMSRGKPSPKQLDLSMDMLNCLDAEDIKNITPDVRNYGGLDGLAPVKKLFADLLSVKCEEVFVGGNSSLNLMYDTLCKGMLFGFCDSE